MKTYKSIVGGEHLGRWTLKHRLGRGGNGEVWLAATPKGEEAAIKILSKLKPIAYARFKDEVTALNHISDIPGILPVLDSYLPPQLNKSRPWFAMPVAIPLVDKVGKLTTREKVRAIAQVAETMAKLHEKGIAHRDIKPANLLIYKNRCCLGDFGLVDYPNKQDITGKREELGPRWTMAPEVRRLGTNADPLSADVYSLMKTLWILLTGVLKGFEGQYVSSDELSIRQYCGELYITPLEELLAEGTQHDPKRRPSMSRVAEKLRKWIEISASFPEHNPLQWAEVQRRLFPFFTPTRASWESLDEIVSVLNLLGEISNLNHLFFPSGGGLDLESVVASKREPGCIELVTNGYINIVKPKTLLFESFNYQPQWNYFRLESLELEPSGVYKKLPEGWIDEDVTDIGGEFYADRAYWDDQEYEGGPLPDGSRVVTRYFRGSFVIFQKTSTYNRLGSTYDGRHNKMTADEFRQHIEKLVLHVKKSKDGAD